jgi:CheY-like chemotaxis protein
MRKPDSTTPRILVADDQADVREALYLLFKGEGYQTDTVNSPAQPRSSKLWAKRSSLCS